MPYLVVPSDITVLENKLASNSARALSWAEWAGLKFSLPLYHSSYTKMGPAEMKSVLTKTYIPGANMTPGMEICIARQKAVSRQAAAGVYWWGGLASFTAGTFWSFRRYNYQAKLVCLPFMAYAGTFVGRMVGDIATGRTTEYGRDKFLAGLPASVYYQDDEK